MRKGISSCCQLTHLQQALGRDQKAFPLTASERGGTGSSAGGSACEMWVIKTNQRANTPLCFSSCPFLPFIKANLGPGNAQRALEREILCVSPRQVQSDFPVCALVQGGGAVAGEGTFQWPLASSASLGASCGGGFCIAVGLIPG